MSANTRTDAEQPDAARDGDEAVLVVQDRDRLERLGIKPSAPVNRCLRSRVRVLPRFACLLELTPRQRHRACDAPAGPDSSGGRAVAGLPPKPGRRRRTGAGPRAPGVRQARRALPGEVITQDPSLKQPRGAAVQARRRGEHLACQRVPHTWRSIIPDTGAVWSPGYRSFRGRAMSDA